MHFGSEIDGSTHVGSENDEKVLIALSCTSVNYLRRRFIDAFSVF